jgi:arabinogalactan endo-1,4-beta-galactosidase
MRITLVLSAVSFAAALTCGQASANDGPVGPTTPADSSLLVATGFIVGADVSTLAAVEAGGARFSENGAVDDPLAILARNGFTHVRLRLFHTPPRGRELVNDLAYDVALAARAKRAGLKLLLDLHYSDSWADPGKQNKPAAWNGLTFDQLRDSVFAYTRDVVAAFVVAGAAPDMIQLGNEVNVGFLWPDGHADKIDAEWVKFATLIQAGRDGARAGLRGASTLFLHHVADPAVVIWHMDNLLRHLAPPDVIGVSYYPFWHGDLTAFTRNMNEIAAKYGKPVVVVETGYPWTNASFDNYPDVYHGVPASGMPAYTPAGQQEFFSRLFTALATIPGGRGAGVFYWEPAWLPGAVFGSPVDNTTIFDQTGAALPVVSFIRGATTPR